MIIIDEERHAFKKGCVLTIGNFDGMHKGHHTLMKATVDKARELAVPSVVWTFKEHPQAKLVRVICGEVFDVAVDLRKDSETYGKWYGVVLSFPLRLNMHAN